MEYWNNGILGIKKDDGRILFSDPCHPYKKDPIPLNPVFQHANIPSLHGLNNGKANFLWPDPENQVFNIRINIADQIKLNELSIDYAHLDLAIYCFDRQLVRP